MSEIPLSQKIRAAWEEGKADVPEDAKGIGGDPEPEGEPKAEPEVKEEPAHHTAARATGWMPEKEWEEAGKDPELWKPANAYLEAGEMKANLKKIRRAVKRRDKQIDALMDERGTIAKRAYEKAKADLTRQREKAIADGDLGKVVAVSDQITDLGEAPSEDDLKLVKDEGTDNAEYQFGEEEKVQIQNWGRKNQWYMQDPTLQAYADAVGAQFMENYEGVTMADALEFAGKEVRKNFPAKFRKGNKASPTVITDNQATGARPSNLGPRVLKPSELDEATQGLYRNFKRAGMFKKNDKDKNGKWTYETWARDAGLVSDR